MKDSLKLILSDKLIRISIILSLVLISLQSILVIIFYSHLPPLIPFLNSQVWGEERLITSSVTFFVPVMLLIVFMINNFLSTLFYKKNVLAARILSFNALLFIFLGLIAFMQIILLVF